MSTSTGEVKQGALATEEVDCDATLTTPSTATATVSEVSEAGLQVISDNYGQLQQQGTTDCVQSSGDLPANDDSPTNSHSISATSISLVNENELQESEVNIPKDKDDDICGGTDREESENSMCGVESVVDEKCGSLVTGEGSSLLHREGEHIILTIEQLSVLSKEEIVEKWTKQDKYIRSLQERLSSLQTEVEESRSCRENEERLKSQLAEIQRKEQYHIMRLSTKENEIQELGAQVQELKNQLTGGGNLKHCLLDPAVNLLFERLVRDLRTSRTKMEEMQNELSAWKFTPDSNTGKQLMSRCRVLIKENEELGRTISSGRLAKLEGDLALQRNFSEELKKGQSELDEFLLEIDEETEGMQGTIVYLQQQLRQAKDRMEQQMRQGPAVHDTSSSPADTCLVSEDAIEPSGGDDTGDSQIVGPQANGDVTSNETEQACSEGELMAPNTQELCLTNGRKRTQSETEESGVSEGQDYGVDKAEHLQTIDELIAPYKRTRSEAVAGEGGVGGEVVPEGELLENGIMTE